VGRSEIDWMVGTLREVLEDSLHLL
jgi:hypothetical protein